MGWLIVLGAVPVGLVIGYSLGGLIDKGLRFLEERNIVIWP